MLEMYKRNRFREELLLDKCEEVLAVEVEIAHVDQRLFQLAPPNAAGMRPIGRCECGAPIHPGQNFCGVCGRSFTTLTQSRTCVRCGAGLRSGDQFCATCGTEAPDVLQALEAAPPDPGSGVPSLDGAALAASAVADTVIIEAPPLDEPRPTAARSAADDLPPMVAPLPVEPVTVAPVAVEAASSPEDAAPKWKPKARTKAAKPAPTVRPAAIQRDAPPAAPTAFDWTANPAPDAAIDAAIDSIPTHPTDPSTPGAGFPLTASIPPPPSLGDLTEPPAVAVVDAPAPDDAAAAVATTPAVDTPRDMAKREAAAAKQRAKDAKARAKARAKAARDARKRGGPEA
ncbi:MAG: hypothetical protein JWO69_953 [Thermoleophilia bacterium]|nr:hypothetical protein [Thermoleophilia bacterium]